MFSAGNGPTRPASTLTGEAGLTVKLIGRSWISPDLNKR